MICDHAEVADGKLFINGGGWGLISPTASSATALAILAHVGWDETNTQRLLEVDLLDEDGLAVSQTYPEGPRPVHVEVKFEVGRPPGTTAGSEINVPLALNFPPLALLPSTRYEWRVEVDHETVDTVSFETRAS